eukprot:2780149-Rhodomonas_salina.1
MDMRMMECFSALRALFCFASTCGPHDRARVVRDVSARNARGRKDRDVRSQRAGCFGCASPSRCPDC